MNKEDAYLQLAMCCATCIHSRWGWVHAGATYGFEKNNRRQEGSCFLLSGDPPTSNVKLPYYARLGMKTGQGYVLSPPDVLPHLFKEGRAPRQQEYVDAALKEFDEVVDKHLGLHRYNLQYAGDEWDRNEHTRRTFKEFEDYQAHLLRLLTRQTERYTRERQVMENLLQAYYDRTKSIVYWWYENLTRIRSVHWVLTCDGWEYDRNSTPTARKVLEAAEREALK